MGRLRGIDDLPIIVIEHLALIVRQTALRVVQDEAGPEGRESRVDMDRIGIAGEVDRMHPVIGEMATDPFDPFEVGRKPVLHHQIPAKTQHVGGVEQRLFLGGDKELLRRPLQALFHADLLREVIRVIIRICQARFGRAFMAEIRVLVEVLLHQRAIVQIFEPAAAIGHCRLKHFRTDRQQHIARRHAAKLALGVEIWRGGGQAVIDTCRAIHPHAAFFQHRGEIIEQLIGAVDRFLRAAAPLAPHVAVFGHLGIERGFFRRDVAVISAADDHMFQRIPFVPAVDLGFLR